MLNWVRNTAVAIALMAAGAMQSASAAPIPMFFFQLLPTAPSNKDPVQVRVDTPFCIAPLDAVVNVSWIPRRIEVQVRKLEIPCDPNNPAHTRFIDVGVLRAGTYEVSVLECEAPPGLTCSVAWTNSLVVSAAPSRYLVPAASWGSLGLLFAAMSLLGLRGSWRNR